MNPWRIFTWFYASVWSQGNICHVDLSDMYVSCASPKCPLKMTKQSKCHFGLPGFRTSRRSKAIFVPAEVQNKASLSQWYQPGYLGWTMMRYRKLWKPHVFFSQDWGTCFKIQQLWRVLFDRWKMLKIGLRSRWRIWVRKALGLPLGFSEFLVFHNFTCPSYGKRDTLQGTITYPPKKWHFEDDFPFSQGGICIHSLEGNFHPGGHCCTQPWRSDLTRAPVARIARFLWYRLGPTPEPNKSQSLGSICFVFSRKLKKSHVVGPRSWSTQEGWSKIWNTLRNSTIRSIWEYIKVTLNYAWGCTVSEAHIALRSARWRPSKSCGTVERERSTAILAAGWFTFTRVRCHFSAVLFFQCNICG